MHSANDRGSTAGALVHRENGRGRTFGVLVHGANDPGRTSRVLVHGANDPGRTSRVRNTVQSDPGRTSQVLVHGANDPGRISRVRNTVYGPSEGPCRLQYLVPRLCASLPKPGGASFATWPRWPSLVPRHQAMTPKCHQLGGVAPRHVAPVSEPSWCTATPLCRYGPRSGGSTTPRRRSGRPWWCSATPFVDVLEVGGAAPRHFAPGRKLDGAARRRVAAVRKSWGPLPWRPAATAHRLTITLLRTGLTGPRALVGDYGGVQVGFFGDCLAQRGARSMFRPRGGSRGAVRPRAGCSLWDGILSPAGKAARPWRVQPGRRPP